MSKFIVTAEHRNDNCPDDSVDYFYNSQNNFYVTDSLSEAKYIIYEKLNKKAQSITNDEGDSFRPVGSFLDYVNKTFVPTFKEKYNSDNEAFSDFENANFDDDIVDSFLKDKISFQLKYLDNHYVILNIENRCVSDYDGFYCRIIQVFRNQKVLLNYDL